MIFKTFNALKYGEFNNYFVAKKNNIVENYSYFNFNHIQYEKTTTFVGRINHF